MAAGSGGGFDRRDHAHAIDFDFKKFRQGQMPKQALAVVVGGPTGGSSVENFYDTLIAGTLFIGHDPCSFLRYPSINVGFALGVRRWAWTQSVQGAIATWSAISMQNFPTILDYHR